MRASRNIPLSVLFSVLLLTSIFKAQSAEPELAVWPTKDILAPDSQHPDWQPVSIPEGWDRKRLNRALREYLRELAQSSLPESTVESNENSTKVSFTTSEYDLDRFAIQKGTKLFRRPVIGPADDGFIITLQFTDRLGRLQRPQLIDTAPWPIFLAPLVYLVELDQFMNVDVHYGAEADQRLLAELCAPTRWLKGILADAEAGRNPCDDYPRRGGRASHKLSPEAWEADRQLKIQKEYNRILHVVRFQPADPSEYDAGIRLAEAFAKKYPKHHLAGNAHLQIAEILVRKKDIDGAISKLKWVGVKFPKTRYQQLIMLGDCPDSMYLEWQKYVEKTAPILLKDYVWYRMAGVHIEAGQYEEALKAYDHIIRNVPPDPIPDTKNYAIAVNFRLHKGAVEQKVELLRRMKRKTEAEKAAAQLEKLYPEAAWKKMRLEADRAYESYIEKDRELRRLKWQEELRRGEEEHKRAQEEAAILWRDQVTSDILNQDELAKLGSAFPKWKIKQITWPSKEIWMAHVRVDDRLKASCIDWLKKFLNEDYLPSNLGENLIAMKEWGLIRDQSEQERLCDVFVTTFKKGPCVIHMQESHYNVVIAVADERLANNARTDHRNFVIEMAASVLKEALKPDPDSENLHVLNTPAEGPKLTRLSWLIESVLFTDAAGKKFVDLTKASQIGTRHVDAETDGRFVRFDIVKCVYGARAFLDPYEKRFPWPKMSLSEVVKAEAQKRDFSKLSPVSRMRYKDYTADDLVRLVADARTRHRHTEAVEAGLLALSWDLTPQQDAFVRDEMAQAYEALSAGPLVRQKYEEVLTLHPDYPRNIEIAYRLAELNSSIIMHGTQENAQRAMEYYQYVLDQCEKLNRDSQKVYYSALSAHMGLGILYWDKNEYARAKEHFEAIYKADLDLAQPLPHKQFDSPRDLADHKRWLKDTIGIVKSRVPEKIVGTCIRPDRKGTVAELEKLIADYAHDPNIADLARKALEEQQDRMKREAAEEERERAKEFKY